MMPSPFPGMDPYLEDRAGWPDVHAMLITTIREQVVGLLPASYSARIEERVYVTHPVGDPGYPGLVPDITIGRRRPAMLRETVAGVISIDPPAVYQELLEPEVRDRFLVIDDKQGQDVVAAIEVLSPANKISGSRGRAALDAKRQVFLDAGASWLEIDLLRAGWRPELLAGRSHYLVALCRGGRNRLEAWLFDVRDRAPVVAVALRAPDDDLPLDLGRALALAYDRARYEYSIDYGGSVPPPALAPTDADWVAQRVTAWRAEVEPPV